MGLIEVGDFVAVGRWVLSFDFVQEGVSGCVFAGPPLGRVGLERLVGIVGPWTRRAPVSLVEPGFSMILELLRLVVPKNLGPTE